MFMAKPLDIYSIMKKCDMCPRECRVDRTEGETGPRPCREAGFCRAGREAEVCAAHLHFGEEPPISGERGSGTIFFNHCNMRCAYCQNYRLSQLDHGKEFKIRELAELMVQLQSKMAHNINLVTPTHYACHIINAVIGARREGLNIPIVYNTGGYEKITTLKKLEGVVDIYLVDMRYGDNKAAKRFSSCDDYVQINQEAVIEMQRQVGYLRLSSGGIAERGVIIRHLILPNSLSGTEAIFKFISERIGNDTYISLMSQYYPTYKADDYTEISRRINKEEYDAAVGLLLKYGLANGWIQEYMAGNADSDFAGTNIEPDV